MPKNKQKKIKQEVKALVKVVKKKRSKVGPPIKVVKGRGDYELGTNIGSKIGGWLGGKIHRGISTIFGSGDYRMVGKGMNSVTGPPQFMSRSRNVVVSHREYLKDISGSTDFTIQSIALNPGLDSFAPWMKNIANNFEEWRMLGCVFMFKSTSAAALNSTNTALGTVIMATQYDSTDPIFTDKRTMENHEFASSTMPFESVLHAVECKPSQTSISNTLYVRNSAPPEDADIRLYDLGVFSLATVGMQEACVIGELWVTYEIEFLKPRLSPIIPVEYSYAHYVPALDSGHYATNTPFGDTSGSQMLLWSGTDIVSFPLDATLCWQIQFPVAGRYFVFAGFNTLTNACTGTITFLNSGVTYSSLVDYSVGPLSNSAFNTGFQGTKKNFATVVDVVDGATIGVSFNQGGTSFVGLPDVYVIKLSGEPHPPPTSKNARITQLEKQLSEVMEYMNSQKQLCSTPSLLEYEEEKQIPVDMTESTVLARAISKLGIVGR